MPAPGEVKIIAISIGSKQAVLDGGEVFALTDVLDAFGDPTDCDDDVVYAVGQLPNGLWCTIDMSEFDDAPLN